MLLLLLFFFFSSPLLSSLFCSPSVPSAFRRCLVTAPSAAPRAELVYALLERAGGRRGAGAAGVGLGVGVGADGSAIGRAAVAEAADTSASFDEASGDALPDDGDAAEHTATRPAFALNSAAARAEAARQYQSYVLSVVTDFQGVAAARIHSMLKMFAASGDRTFVYQLSEAGLQELLAQLVMEGHLECSDGLYKKIVKR